MKQITYTMQFKGQAAPSNDAGTEMTASTSAPSSAITTLVSAEGVEGMIEPIDGGKATFESEVVVGDGGAFKETGTITFGDGNQLTFSTVGDGFMGASADPNLTHGTIMWRVDSGTGQFEGATGLITSNFTVGSKGEVTDNQFGVIFLAS